MRNSADLPRRSRKPSRFKDRGRTLLIIAAVVVVGLLLSARFLSGFYVDYLWHESVGRTDVFWGVLGAKFTMFALFAGTFIVLALLNLIIADRLAPSTFSANTHPVVERFHEFFGHRMRLFRFAVAIVFGLLFAAPAIGRWQDWLMFRNSKSFGINDPHFGNDVGFYMFKLPFVTFVLDWLFIAVAFITVLVVATHVLSGGIVIQPPRPKVRKATKAHVAVLLSLLAILKAGDYWVTRYELTTANRGAVRGITYAVDNAQLPAVLLLALIALLTAGLYLSTLKTDRWRPAVVASALWAVVALIGGVIYPSAIQSLVVTPNQKDKEAKYIEYNIDATRHALGIDNVIEESVEFGDLSTSEVNTNVAALQDVRLLKPSEQLETRFQTDEGRPGTRINDIDPDRYEVDGVVRQVVVGARELDLNQVGNKSWQGTHLINTHGCGLIVSPAGQINTNRRPAYDDTIVSLDRPELYFGTSISGYAIVNTSVTEQACEGQEVAPYEGEGGVQLSSTLRKLAFALDEWDYNLIGTSSITDESRLISVRNIRDRVAAAAPFLSLDGDPYPVALDGRVIWVIDGYTTSNRYPYGEGADLSQLESGSGLKAHPFNYVRNSVKATVDAYDGSITLYAIDPDDPVLQVWMSAFPDLVSSADEMPDGLREHLRYPEELFRIQTAAYSKYRLSPDTFFERKGAWSVAPAALEQAKSTSPTDATTTTTVAADAAQPASSTEFASDSNSARFEPYYAMFHPDGGGEATFQLYRPYQPFSPTDQFRTLISYMTASSDPETYGQLVVRTVSGEIDGPSKVGSAMSSDPAVSDYVTANNQQGSTVEFGDLQMVPVADSLLWFRPLYVEAKGSGQPLTNQMIVAYNGKVAMDDSFSGALQQLFPGFRGDVGDVVGTDEPDPDDPGDPNEPNPDATAEELLDEAQTLFEEADEALADGDFGVYGEKVAAARELVAQALELLQN